VTREEIGDAAERDYYSTIDYGVLQPSNDLKITKITQCSIINKTCALPCGLANALIVNVL
jgi:hypothetical protein